MPHTPGQHPRSFIDSPLGWLAIESSAAGLRSVAFLDEKDAAADTGDALCQEAARQLKAYFAGKRKTFDLPLDASGSVFQLTVWEALLQIPFGETISYGGLSARIGNPKAIRAVGHANGQNPLAIIVPCHRVIGADGTLTGYGGGLWRKKWLLTHESSLPPELPF